MKVEKYLKQLLILSLTVVMLMGTIGCSKAKNEEVNKYSKTQFTNALKEIVELSSKAQSGSLEDDSENYSEEKYGKFAELIETEKQYYISLVKQMKSFEEEAKDLAIEEINFEDPSSTEDIKEAADSLDKSIEVYLDNIKKLTDNNIKEIEALDIPKDYKEIYLEAKKDISKALDKYIGKINTSSKKSTDGLREMADILDKSFKEKDLEKINEYIERLQKIAMEMQTTATEVNDVEKNFRKDIEEINLNSASC